MSADDQRDNKEKALDYLRTESDHLRRSPALVHNAWELRYQIHQMKAVPVEVAEVAHIGPVAGFVGHIRHTGRLGIQTAPVLVLGAPDRLQEAEAIER